MQSSPALTGKVKASLNWFSGQALSLLITGQAVAALAGLVYGKLTALYIPPAELGFYNLLFAAMTFLYSLLVSPIAQSVKASLAHESVQNTFITHGILLLIIYAVALLSVGVVGVIYGNGLLFLVWGAAAGQCIYALGNDYLNIKGRYTAFTSLQISYALVNLLLLVVITRNPNWQNATGLWWSLAIVNLLFAGLASRSLWQLLTVANEALPGKTIKTAFRQIIPYALPLAGTAFWAWIINYADRYLIRYYLTDADVGYYAMGYSLGSKLLLLVAPFVTYLTGAAIRQKANGESMKAFQRLQSSYVLRYAALASGACLLFYLGRNWFGRFFLSLHYEKAFQIGPLVAISYLFITLIYLFEVKWYIYGTTRYMLWHNVLGALCNVALNLWLIPIYGVCGAAFAMIGSTGAQLCVVLYLYKKS